MVGYHTDPQQNGRRPGSSARPRGRYDVVLIDIETARRGELIRVLMGHPQHPRMTQDEAIHLIARRPSVIANAVTLEEAVRLELACEVYGALVDIHPTRDIFWFTDETE